MVLEDVETGRVMGAASLGMKQMTWINDNTGDNVESGKVGHCFNLRLHPDYRGKGLSKPLAQKRKELAAARGCTHIYGAVAPTNTPSLRLWEPLCDSTNHWVFMLEIDQLPPLPNNSVAIKASCQEIPKGPQAGALMRQTHGKKLFFPCDIDDLSQHSNCLGTFQGNYNSSDDNESTTTSVLFGLWDSSATHKWQFCFHGQKLPVQYQAVMYGLCANNEDCRTDNDSSSSKTECFQALLHHAIESTLVGTHQRILCFVPAESNVGHWMSSMKQPIGWEYMSDMTLNITRCTNDDNPGQQQDQSRFFSAVNSPNNVFCDPRDY